MENKTLDTKCKNNLRSSLLALSLATGFVCSTSWADDGIFNVAGRLNGYYDFPTATTLLNGKVLITGSAFGFPGPVGPSAQELYDPLTHQVTPTGGRKRATTDFDVATLLNDGTVLILDGLRLGAHLYNPATNTFSLTGEPVNENKYPSAIRLGNGQVLVINHEQQGGLAAELYDPVTKSFKLTGKMVQDRMGLETTTLLPDGRVLITGGYNPNSCIAEAELYDPMTGVFTRTANMSIARGNGSIAALLPNGKVLIAGGGCNTTDKSAELYDPVTNTFGPAGDLQEPRAFATGALLPSGKVLIAGGYTLVSGNVAALGNDSAELYDPTTNTFAYTGSSTYARSWAAAAVLLPLGQSDQVLFVGGYPGRVGNFDFAYGNVIEGYTEIVHPVPPPITF